MEALKFDDQRDSMEGRYFLVFVLYGTIEDLISKETVCCVGGKVKH